MVLQWHALLKVAIKGFFMISNLVNLRLVAIFVFRNIWLMVFTILIFIFMNPVVSRAKYEELVAQNPQMPHYYIDEAHEKIPAGWMIDQCGWKGRSLGRAGVHDKQALVLVNRGGATGNEVVALCREIQRDVKEKFGIDISPEVNIV